MVSNVASAIAAYSNAAERTPRADGATGAAPGGSFADMVRDMVGNTVEAGRSAERISGEAMVGRADINDVVMAVTNAEMGLQTVVSIRDRIIEAYQQIARMPI